MTKTDGHDARGGEVSPPEEGSCHWIVTLHGAVASEPVTLPTEVIASLYDDMGLGQPASPGLVGWGTSTVTGIVKQDVEVVAPADWSALAVASWIDQHLDVDQRDGRRWVLQGIARADGYEIIGGGR